jgi:hypothetical protein
LPCHLWAVSCLSVICISVLWYIHGVEIISWVVVSCCFTQLIICGRIWRKIFSHRITGLFGLFHRPVF